MEDYDTYQKRIDSELEQLLVEVKSGNICVEKAYHFFKQNYRVTSPKWQEICEKIGLK